MTKKLKILLISVFLLIATVCVCLFAGCKVKYTVDELREKYKLTTRITYFLNGDGGSFNGSYVKDLYYKTGAMPMNLGNSALISGSSELTIKKGNKFTGWYYVKTDGTGNPLYTDGEQEKVYNDGDEYDVTKGMSMVKTDEPFDFSKPLEGDQHIYLCGDFIGDVKVELHLLCEQFGDSKFDQIQYNSGDETVTVKDGEIIEAYSLGIPQSVTGLGNYSSALQSAFGTDYSVVDFYEKDEATGKYTPFTGWPIKYPAPDAEGKYHNKVLYLKVLDGEWNILSTASDVANMFASGSFKYYLPKDIDCEGESVNCLTYFGGTLYGGEEGHVIKNFKVQTQNDASITNKSSVSMFGIIRSSAVIKNVTIEAATVNFKVLNGHDPMNIRFIANEIENGATFENFKVSGSLNITLGTGSNATGLSEDDWLFDKDDATYKEITVTSATCTITDASGGTETYTVNNNQTEDQQ